MLILSDKPLSEKQLKLVAVLKAFSCGSIFKPNFDDEGVQRVWVSKLEGLPPKGLLKALDELCVKKEFPSIEKIIEVVNGNDGQSADEAFAQVWVALLPYARRDHLSAQVQATVQKIGGWTHIATNWSEGSKSFHKREFKEAFESVCSAFSVGAPLLDSAQIAENSRVQSERSAEVHFQHNEKKNLVTSSDLPAVFGRLETKKPKKVNPIQRDPLFKKAKQQLLRWAETKVRATAFKQRLKEFSQNANVDQMVAAVWYVKNSDTFPSDFELIHEHEKNNQVQELKNELSKTILRIVEDKTDD